MRWKLSLLTGFISLNRVSGIEQGEIRGVSLFGLETPLANTDCSWVYPASYYIDVAGSKGFNWLRVPFSGEYVRNSNFQVMDQIFDACARNNISILLDWHRNVNSFQDNWLEHITIDEYFQLYKQLINRYAYSPQLQMLGIFNEFKGEDSAYWKTQMGSVLGHMEDMYPYRFSYMVGCPQWSGNCHDMDWSHLPFYDRVYYDIHKYIFSTPATPEAYEFSFPKDKSKVIVGEWGFFNHQAEWAKMFIQWTTTHGIYNNFFWQLTQDSSDTGGLFTGDCKVFEEEKYQIIQTFWKQEKKRGLSNNEIFRGTLPQHRRLRDNTSGSLGSDYRIENDEDGDDVVVVMDASPIKYSPYYTYGNDPCHLRRHP